MGASTLVFRGIVDPEVIESIACREGMALASYLRAYSIRLASDCMNVVKSIRQSDLEIYEQVIQEINTRKTALSSVEFVHEYKKSNTDVHRIARSSIPRPGPCGLPPPPAGRDPVRAATPACHSPELQTAWLPACPCWLQRRPPPGDPASGQHSPRSAPGPAASAPYSVAGSPLAAGHSSQVTEVR
jgi:hypothetical protein